VEAARDGGRHRHAGYPLRGCALVAACGRVPKHRAGGTPDAAKVGGVGCALAGRGARRPAAEGEAPAAPLCWGRTARVDRWRTGNGMREAARRRWQPAALRRDAGGGESQVAAGSTAGCGRRRGAGGGGALGVAGEGERECGSLRVWRTSPVLPHP